MIVNSHMSHIRKLSHMKITRWNIKTYDRSSMGNQNGRSGNHQ